MTERIVRTDQVPGLLALPRDWRAENARGAARLETGLRAAGRVLDAHRTLGGLTFGYGQGSVFTGFVDDSDLDINLVWDRPEVPGVTEVPGATERSRFVLPEMALDKLSVDGWQVDLVHHTERTFDDWRTKVASGDGWQTDAWPLPLYAVAGFAYGVVLEDPDGVASGAIDQLQGFPDPLVERSRDVLAGELSSYDGELAGCVRGSDGWLFHQLLTRLMRTAYVAWFSKHRRYCPFPKRLPAWADRFGFDDGIAELDRRLWATPGLASKRELARAIGERVLEG